MTKEKDLLPKKFQQYMEMMGDESDRGSVLVCAVILENTLEEMILAKLAPSASNSDELMGSSFSPLGSFASKIEIAYRLGLIRNDLRRSLVSLKKIRNDFAHASIKNGFENESTQQKIMNMVSYNKAVVDSIVEAVAKDKGDTEFNLENMIAITGWRFLLEIVFACMAAGLSEQIQHIDKIEVLE